jgi:addiction module HigA family antidote
MTKHCDIRIRTHPGEMLREEFMPDFGLKAPTLAKLLGVTRSRLQRLMDESAPVSPEMALRLGKVFGTTPDFWMNLQTAHDLSQAQRAAGAEIERLRELHRPAA